MSHPLASLGWVDLEPSHGNGGGDPLANEEITRAVGDTLVAHEGARHHAERALRTAEREGATPNTLLALRSTLDAVSRLIRSLHQGTHLAGNQQKLL